jgi:hypothetical protein
MKHFKFLAIGVLIGAAVLIASSSASAQDIAVDLTEWDYGNVEVGQARTQLFTVESTDLVSPLTIGYIGINWGSSAFTITDLPYALGTHLFVGESFQIEVTYTPPDDGVHEAYLYILSNADPDPEFGPEIFIGLYGKGCVDDCPDTGELMADAIAFFDEAVAIGTLEGDGPTEQAAGNRLRAFGNMLDSANDLIQLGEYALACDQLWSAYLKADGQHPPSADFVQGAAWEALAAMILNVMDDLGCPY